MAASLSALRRPVKRLGFSELARGGALSADVPARAFSFPARAEEQPNWYAVLGVKRDATPEQIKQAFREQAKLHHPDVKHGKSTEADLNVFKLINEAYSVLSNPALRRQYDHERFSRSTTLRERNEGVYGGIAPPEAGAGAESAYANAGSRPGLGQGQGQPQDHEEAVRLSMYRAAEKQREGARFRAALARMQRQKIEVPAQGRALNALVVPAAVVGIWAVNYFLFMR